MKRIEWLITQIKAYGSLWRISTIVREKQNPGFAKLMLVVNSFHKNDPPCHFFRLKSTIHHCQIQMGWPAFWKIERKCCRPMSHWPTFYRHPPGKRGDYYLYIHMAENNAQKCTPNCHDFWLKRWQHLSHMHPKKGVVSEFTGRLSFGTKMVIQSKYFPCFIKVGTH